jgi:hypothetical protein
MNFNFITIWGNVAVDFYDTLTHTQWNTYAESHSNKRMLRRRQCAWGRNKQMDNKLIIINMLEFIKVTRCRFTSSLCPVHSLYGRVEEPNDEISIERRGCSTAFTARPAITHMKYVKTCHDAERERERDISHFNILSMKTKRPTVHAACSCVSCCYYYYYVCVCVCVCLYII